MGPDSPFSEEIQKKLAALPEDMRNLVYSSDMAAIIQQIGQKHQLHIDQIGALEAEAAAAMLGVTALSELPQNIADALSVDERTGAALAADVNDLLFIKIRESMKGLYGDTPRTPSPAPAAANVPPPQPTPAPRPAGPPAAPVMPAQQTPTPSATPAPAEIKPAVPPSAAPAQKMPVGMPPSADAMLALPSISAPKTVEMLPQKPVPASLPQQSAPTMPQKPQPKTYAVDPYREPVA
jgi:hypothetical protein